MALTVSWWTYLSFNPNMIAYAMAKTSYSGEMVRNNRKMILTIPGAEIADAVMGCGSTTGRNTDKVSKFNIELKAVEGSSIQIPVHSRVAIVCSLKEYHEAGDHYLYICDVEQVYGVYNGTFSSIVPLPQILIFRSVSSILPQFRDRGNSLLWCRRWYIWTRRYAT